MDATAQIIPFNPQEPERPITLKIFTEALLKANEGDAEAANILGICYFQGEGNQQVNTAEAFRWWATAAEKGHIRAMYNTARFNLLNLKEEKATQEDFNQAFAMLLAVIDSDDKHVIPMAQHTVYMAFQAYPQYMQEAKVPAKYPIMQLDKAAKEGYVDAMLDLGLFLIQQSASKGHTIAQRVHRAIEAEAARMNNPVNLG